MHQDSILSLNQLGGWIEQKKKKKGKETTNSNINNLMTT